MAQPMTLVATPEPDDAGCPELVPFCSGVCREYGDGYHSSDFTYIQVKRWKRGRYRKAMMSFAVYRDATKNGKLGKPKVTVITDDFGDQISLSPARARMLAAHLLNVADEADPLPVGVFSISASQVRVGDEMDTPDGWQRVKGLLTFADANQAALFTAEKCDCDSDGYQHSMSDQVKVRRPLNTADPILNRATFSAVAYCTECRSDQLIVGTRHTSRFGVLRVRGCCQTCGKRQHSIVAWSPTGAVR